MVKSPEQKSIQIHYYALLREQRGLPTEALLTNVQTARQLYAELIVRYGFKLKLDILKVAINNEFSDWDTVLKDNDTVVFIPPVAGG